MTAPSGVISESRVIAVARTISMSSKRLFKAKDFFKMALRCSAVSSGGAGRIC